TLRMTSCTRWARCELMLGYEKPFAFDGRICPTSLDRSGRPDLTAHPSMTAVQTAPPLSFARVDLTLTPGCWYRGHQRIRRTLISHRDSGSGDPRGRHYLCASP